MAVVLILSADLMFASRLLASLTEAGHQPELLGGEAALRGRLSGASEIDGGVLIADLTDDRLDGSAALESLRSEEMLGSLKTIAFFSHVETDVRERAQAAGFDQVVPRSRIAREAPALLASLTSS